MWLFIPWVGRSALRAYLLAMLALVALLPAAGVSARGFDASRVRGSVVYVAISDGRNVVGRGSGIIVAPNIVLTNAHVAVPGRRLFVVRHGDDGTGAVEAFVVSRSAVDDLAILRTARLVGRPMAIAATDPELGSAIWAVGFPVLSGGLENDAQVQAILTSGTVARVFDGRTLNSPPGPMTRFVQHTAVLAPGNSGGPLVDSCYRLVGVNDVLAIRARDVRYFAVGSSVVPALMEQAGIRPTIARGDCGTSARFREPRTGKGQRPPGAAAPSTPDQPTTASTPPPVTTSDPAAAPTAPRPPEGTSGSEPAVVEPDANGAPMDDIAVDATPETQLERAQQRAIAARRQEAAALAARRRAIAARNSAEAARQARIADNARRIAADMDEYSARLQDQLDGARGRPLERYGPLALLVIALLALGGTFWFVRRRQQEYAQRRDRARLGLQLTEAQLAARTMQTVTLIGEHIALKLPGTELAQGLTVGRSPEKARVVFAKEEVGRLHARFYMEDDVHSGAQPPTYSLFVVDLGSVNGTFVNGRRIQANQPVRLAQADRVGFSRLYEFTVRIEKGN